MNVAVCKKCAEVFSRVRKVFDALDHQMFGQHSGGLAHCPRSKEEAQRVLAMSAEICSCLHSLVFLSSRPVASEGSEPIAQVVAGLMAVGLLAQGVGLVGGLYRLFDGVLDDQACRALCVVIGVAYFSFSAWGLVSCSRGLIRVRNLLKGRANAAKRKRNKAAPLCCSDMRRNGHGWSLVSLMGMVAVWTVTANAAVSVDVVKGWVRLETTPSLAEIAEEYATTDARRLEHAALQIMKRQAGQGVQYSRLCGGAVCAEGWDPSPGRLCVRAPNYIR